VGPSSAREWLSPRALNSSLLTLSSAYFIVQQALLAQRH
jgi:hypothetical protein